MWARLESWQLSQLEWLANMDPERVESMLNTLWSQYPGLYKELALSAIDHEILSIEDGADRLRQPRDSVEQDVIDFRNNRTPEDAAKVVHDRKRKIAYVADGCVAVWEIIREFRKLGSMEELKNSFPALSERDLLTALRYAREHAQEVEEHISHYETVMERIREQYPYAKAK